MNKRGLETISFRMAPECAELLHEMCEFMGISVDKYCYDLVAADFAYVCRTDPWIRHLFLVRDYPAGSRADQLKQQIKSEMLPETGPIVVTKQMMEAWQQGVRSLWARLVKKYKGSSNKAEKALKTKLRDKKISPDDIQWAFEIILEKRDVTMQEAQRMLTRFNEEAPLLEAFSELLKA